MGRDVRRGRLIHEGYQDDFVMPGISPLEASSRKQMRQTPKNLMNPWRRPQSVQRLYTRVGNSGFLPAAFASRKFSSFRFWLMTIDLRAMGWGILAKGGVKVKARDARRARLYKVRKGRISCRP